jgi:hypothetical protein
MDCVTYFERAQARGWMAGFNAGGMADEPFILYLVGLPSTERDQAS